VKKLRNKNNTEDDHEGPDEVGGAAHGADRGDFHVFLGIEIRRVETWEKSFEKMRDLPFQMKRV
jgi:hypothetical protein